VLLPVPAGFALVALFALASAAAFTRSKSLGVAAAAPAPLVPLAVDTIPFGKTVLAVAGVCVLARALDLRKDPKQYRFLFRLWFLGTPFDGRRIWRVRPEPDIGLTVATTGYGGLFIASYWLLSNHPLATPWRWLVGLVAAYSMVDTVAALVTLVYASLGIRFDSVHRAPILSRTIQEFWGERWNRPVHSLLMDHFFRPFARRSVRFAVGAAFLGSAVLHFWIAFVAIGFVQASSMAIFFVVQGALVLIERRLHVARWGPVYGRLWTVAAFTLTSPLFIEPYLRILGV